MQFTVIGSGDAFGTGGRLHTCYMIEAAGRRVLLDCGVTSQTGLNRQGIDANGIDTIVLSHLHGDHFGGLVWIMLTAQYSSKRKAPLKVIGPPTTAERYKAAAEALFPGMTGIKRAFELEFVEITAAKSYADADLAVQAFEVCHPADAPSHGLRLTIGGRTVAFSGDTEWVEALVDVARDADLYITECCGLDRPMKYHLDWRTLEKQLPRLTARKVMISHMNADMLAFAPSVAGGRIVIAEDGLSLSL